MPNNISQSITIFWSWQNDSPSKQNKNFLGDCIQRAAKKAGKENAILIEIDRDTIGVGGTPEIANAIFTKIRDSDIFVWDETLVYFDPKPSPNPNVLIEFGYALAVLGTGRIIGIMNVENGTKGEDLPFDLAHRRFPIFYSLRAPGDEASQEEEERFKVERREVRRLLVDELVTAINWSLNEQKKGVFHSDENFQIAKELWDIIDSSWITYWSSNRNNNPQFETKETYDRILEYLDTSVRPEHMFSNQVLKTLHDTLRMSFDKYLVTVATEMIPDGPAAYVITSKRSGWIENYDEIYDRQVSAIRSSLRTLIESWVDYVRELRSIYPEIVYQT